MTVALLAVENLVRHFQPRRRHPFDHPPVVRAVDGISFTLAGGETLGLVGESGCGKSTTGRLVLGIDRPTSGSVKFNGTELADQSVQAWRDQRRQMQMVFQDPAGALDPRITAARQIEEPLTIHGIGSAEERQQTVNEICDAVGLPEVTKSRFPHELSGGQQQRVVIARALVLRPSLIVCDEPISALDVSIQAQVVNLLADLKFRFGLAYLFISHDLKVVRHISDRIAVMYLGEIVESGSREDLFERPMHPYTRALISAVPVPDPRARAQRVILKGDPPSPINPPSGCRFHTRCPMAGPQCAEQKPEPKTVAGHTVACHFADFDNLETKGS